MTTKKRRAKTGEVRLWDLSVIAYQNGSQTRVTVRGDGTTVEASSRWPLVALLRAFLRHRRAVQSPDAMIARLESAARELGRTDSLATNL